MSTWPVTHSMVAMAATLTLAFGMQAPARAQSAPAWPLQVAQASSPATTIRQTSPDSVMVTISDGSYRFNGMLVRTTGNQFSGQDPRTNRRMMLDRSTGRLVVINEKNGEEIYNYVVKSPGSSSAADPLATAKSNCLAAVAKQVGVSRGSLKVIKAQSAQSGIGVDVKVPNAAAPWFCFADRKGTVKEVRFKGSEGAL